MNIFDVHIKNGEVIDGTGAPKFKSDIVINKAYRIPEKKRIQKFFIYLHPLRANINLLMFFYRR